MSKRRNVRQSVLSVVLLFALVASCFSMPVVVSGAEFQEVPLTNYTKSWLGNDYPGLGENGYGEWVQNHAENADFVNGTVVTAAYWDEAGRCTGLFRDGKINTETIQTNPARSAWGWGTASYAVAANETDFWLFTTAHDLLHFTWDYTDLNSHSYVGFAEAPAMGLVVSMTEKDNTLYALRENGVVEVWDGMALTKTKEFTIAGASRLTINPDTNELWVIVGNEIKNFDTSGSPLGRTISDAGKPVNVSIDEQYGQLVVCDNGPRQQILFYDISGSGIPKMVKTLGDEGGISSGKPGEYTPNKLFAITAAGTDKAGNVYVTMSHGMCIIRQYSPEGELVWERKSFSFTDCVDFLPGSDGTLIYGIDEIYEVDYSKSYGKEATIKAYTADLLKDPQEYQGGEIPRSNFWVRVIGGRRVMFMNSMTLNTRVGKPGLDMYTFDTEDSYIANYVGTFEAGGWAYDIDENGSIWICQDEKLKRFDFGGFDSNGCPKYSADNSKSFDIPVGFTKVERIVYDEKNDVMYLSGYSEDYRENMWGLAGRILRAYDWKDGKAMPIFRLIFPIEADSDNYLGPRAFEVAGDYIFAVTSASAKVHVFSTKDGKYIGTMQTTPELGTSGWVDIPYGIRVTQRSNGDYIIAVEEDWRAKNILYRWNPNGLAEPGTSEPEEPEAPEENTDEIKVFFDGNKVEFDVPPMIISDRTMVPVRAVFEALGATVNWEAETQTVISEKDDRKVTIGINEAHMSVNGEEKALDVPAQIVDDRTLVPLRAISEAYGCEVAWDGETRTITITR